MPTQTQTTNYRQPVFPTLFSGNATCSACGADLEPGDIVKIYSQRMDEAVARHDTYTDGRPRVVTHMTRIFGVTRHVKGKAIECHPDNRKQTTKPSAVKPENTQPDIQAVVAAAVKQALEAVAEPQKKKRKKKTI